MVSPWSGYSSGPPKETVSMPSSATSSSASQPAAAWAGWEGVVGSAVPPGAEEPSTARAAIAAPMVARDLERWSIDGPSGRSSPLDIARWPTALPCVPSSRSADLDG